MDLTISPSGKMYTCAATDDAHALLSRARRSTRPMIRSGFNLVAIRANFLDSQVVDILVARLRDLLGRFYCHLTSTVNLPRRSLTTLMLLTPGLFSKVSTTNCPTSAKLTWRVLEEMDFSR